MPSCSIENCTNYEGSKSAGLVTFHRFPTDEQLRRVWSLKCGRREPSNYRTARVCSQHFAEGDFERDLKGELLGLPLKKRLKNGVVPHINVIQIKEELVSDDEFDSGNQQIEINADSPANPISSVELCTTLDQIGGLAQCIIVPENRNPSEQVATLSTRTSTIPSSQNWPGIYEFDICFEVQDKVTKGIPWTYSKVADKLYVNKDAPCPVSFRTNIPMAEGVQIRIMPLFSTTEHITDIVRRCLYHSLEEQSQGILEADHLVRCESAAAVYEIDGVTKRHSVVVPFENPPLGHKFSTYLFRFVCFGSCPGGPNRRPLMLVFTLEKGQRVLGRRKVDLKICACPGRDKRIDERQLGITHQTEFPAEKRKADESYGTLADSLEFTKQVIFPPPKKTKPNAGNSSNYTISVNDYGCYLFLLQMKKFYEIGMVLKDPRYAKKALLDYKLKKRQEKHDRSDSDAD